MKMFKIIILPYKVLKEILIRIAVLVIVDLSFIIRLICNTILMPLLGIERCSSICEKIYPSINKIFNKILSLFSNSEVY